MIYLPRGLLVAEDETVFMVIGVEETAPFTVKGGKVVIQQKQGGT